MKKINFRDEEKKFLIDTDSIGLKFIEKYELPCGERVIYFFTHRNTPIKMCLHFDEEIGVYFRADEITIDGEKKDFCFDAGGVINTFYGSSCRDGLDDLMSFLNKTLTQHNKKTNNII